MSKSVKHLVMLALFTTMALTIFVVEAQIPVPVPIPGVKLGLANVITLIVLVVYRPRDAFAVLVLRILLGSIFTGTPVSLLYSLTGGILCFLGMALLCKLLQKKHLWFISIVGAVLHHVGQILAAIAVMQELSTQETYELLLLAASLPQVSVWQSVYDGSRLHDVYAGIAAVVTDHLLPLVKRGVRSDGKIVESVYREVMGAEIFPEKLSKGLGKEYVLCSNYFKVHTGCRFIHPFADALKEELTQGLSRDQVEGIDVFTYKKAAQIGDECVPNDLAAKFSTPVSLAVLLEKGSLSPDSIKNCEKDDAITRWAGKIHLHEDTSYNELLPE